jgi:hypothetical protein
LRRPVRLARIASAIPVNKPPVRSFSPARTPTPRAKDMGSTASRHSLRARRPAQFPIEPAAPPVPHPPRFRALALFGRRPPERVDRLGIPASENLHRSRLSRCKKPFAPTPDARDSPIPIASGPPASSPAGSSPGGFRTTAAVNATPPTKGRHPNSRSAGSTGCKNFANN